MKNKGLVISLSVLAIIILSLFSFRAFSSVHLDDLHPSIQCDDELILDSDVLWVIPLLNNDSIANHPDWCARVLSFNKTLGIHGVYHTYREFTYVRDDEYLQEGIDAFKSCFGYNPEMFKPPQVRYNRGNNLLLKANNLSYYGSFNQFTHKAYHCSDTGYFSNSLIRIF